MQRYQKDDEELDSAKESYELQSCSGFQTHLTGSADTGKLGEEKIVYKAEKAGNRVEEIVLYATIGKEHKVKDDPGNQRDVDMLD